MKIFTNGKWFVEQLNGLVPSIKFTVEEEQNSSISFLDIKIHRHNNSFKFSVYRKPTNNLSYLHYYSHHASNVKISVFQSMFLRALRICSPDFIDQEIKFIYSIARDHQYPEHLIDDAYHRAIKSHHNSNVSRDPIQNVLTLPFHRPFLPLVNIFKHHFNITIVFHYNNTIKNILINNNPNKPEACIYKIPCENCPLVYVGQTGKSLEARVKQHKYSTRSGQENSALFQHLRGFNHRINFDLSSVIKCNSNFTERNIIESAIIQTHKNLLNTSQGLYTLDPFVASSITKFLNVRITQ